jgi:hypothetical protein
MPSQSEEPGYLNLDPKQYEVAVSPKQTQQELKSRLAREEAEAAHQRRKDFILFVAAVLGVAAVVVLCLVTIALPDRSPDDKKWATSILTSIVSSTVFYLFGKGKAAVK